MSNRISKIKPHTKSNECIFFSGSHHQCQCKEEFNTLIHLDLWPVTPIKPNTVVSINLMNLFVSLQLEGKISFQSFCDGLSWKSGVIDVDLVTSQCNIIIF